MLTLESDTWGRYFWFQISMWRGLGGRGGIHYLQHFQSFIMGGCTGLAEQGVLYACEDYWQYTPTKQLWKANNCLKVNNNTMLSRQGGRWFYLVNINQIELIFPTYVSFMRCSYEACDSWFIFIAYAQKCEGGKGFSRIHKEMNRICRAMPICL